MVSATSATGAARVSPAWMPAVLVFLLTVDLFFLAAHLASFAAFGYVPRTIYLDEENNIPTWWSSAQLLLAGAILAVVALRCFFVRRAARLLGLLAFLLVAMSLDEMASLHEKVGGTLDWVFGDRQGTPFHHTGLWFAVIGVPFAVLVAVVLRHLSSFLAEVPGTRIRLALGFAVLLAGAVGVEALSNFTVSEEVLAVPFQSTTYIVLVGVEEVLEMIGGSLLLWAAFGFARNHWSTRGFAELMTPLNPRHAAA